MADPKYRTPEYQAARKAYTQAQREGQWLTCAQPVCVMPSRNITPSEPVHVGHDDTGTMVIGPTHALCNVTDGGKRRHIKRLTPPRWVL